MTSVSPYLESLKKEGETGKRKLNQYTRYGTILLAVSQSTAMAIGLESLTGQAGAAVLNPGFFFRLTTVLTLTGGTLFIMWLGEQITARGIGQGSSLIICAGILANLPQSVFSTLELGRQGALSVLVIAAILLGVAFVIVYIVCMEKAQRRIPIQYPKRQVAAHLPPVAKSSYLPLKLNSAGVIPPIFASSLLLMPGTILGFASIDPNSVWGQVGRVLNHGHPFYMCCFVGLILFFSFFYTAIVFNPKETADNLKKSGAYIPGFRPGQQTIDYFDYVLTRLTVVGSLYLAFLCILPEIILANVHLPFYFGGTSFLITIGVTIELLNQVQSHLVTHQYEGLIKTKQLKSRL
jgi:preprotein translocase subunit SecY